MQSGDLHQLWLIVPLSSPSSHPAKRRKKKSRKTQVQSGDLHAPTLIDFLPLKTTFDLLLPVSELFFQTPTCHPPLPCPSHKTLVFCLCQQARWAALLFADRKVAEVNLTGNSIQFRHKGKGGANQGRKVFEEKNLWQQFLVHAQEENKLLQNFSKIETYKVGLFDFFSEYISVDPLLAF